MEWFMFPDEQSRTTGNPNLASHSEVPQASVENMVSLCESQQQYVKASIVSHWQLVEAQDQLGGLELHSSESAEQAHARALASSAHISQAEQEWRLKESMLGVEADPRCSPVLGPEVDRGGFDRSIINDPLPSEADSDNSLPFVQRHEQHLKHFGMLHRWDDSQHFLAQFPHIIREETANYLILWCFRLYAENKGALMEQVAHQAVAMQFILEMARNTQQDPRGCFRQFFQKAKAGQEGYLDVFQTELEAFKHRVREYAVKSNRDRPKGPEQKDTLPSCRLDPREVLESLPPELKACIQSQDMHILQNVLSTMNPQVAEYHIKRCLEAGLCATPGRGPKEDDWETEELKMMEMS
ncbi:hsp90 co-chaperone Cdc37-like 1 isoform X1 [Electrophorus electricus]|uniref:Hsp90 co-chaperone Cdc37-like 1 n=2 Tax=Electrophorus electricus TaxID=8005 RepID=A0A4W4FBT6_ELEEL|nr:hsp90 co-chaperone Cdc37-like 1 isoform X1 [Electrophorus electricus]